MDNVSYSIVKDVKEIEILRNRSGKYNDFVYTYEEPTLDLLKKNFTLPDSLYVIAKQDGEFVAFCSIDRDWWEDNYFMIREIMVDPIFQKQGIGETIMSKCVDHAKSKGAIGVVTETAFENIPMQKLCAKFHFKKWDNPQWKNGITYKLIFEKSNDTIPQIIKDVGFDFEWSSPKIWALDIPVETMPISELAWHFDIPFWDSEGTDEYNLTPNQVLEYPEQEPTHYKKIVEADLAYPIDIMENKGRWLILDGLHRLTKAKLQGLDEIQVRKVPREMIPLITK